METNPTCTAGHVQKWKLRPTNQSSRGALLQNFTSKERVSIDNADLIPTG